MNVLYINYGAIIKINMRKMFKLKKHSCALCKPHKTGRQNRWKSKEFSKMKIFEKEKMLIIKNKLAEIDI